MQVLVFLATRAGLVALLMIVVLVTPAPGLGDTPDTHSISDVVADSHSVSAEHTAHDDLPDRSCHPDPTCSPVAILMNRPISRANLFNAVRQQFVAMTESGRSGRVDPPPPRTRSGPQPNH